MIRISRDEWGLRTAEVQALRATCLRRSVGCVLTDRDGFILSTGYNGRAAGLPHCNEPVFREPTPAIPGLSMFHTTLPKSAEYFPHACLGATSPSGTNLDACEALHAEQNSLLRCREVRDIHTCYVTVSPCITCVKLLLNTSCQRIVFRAPYTHDEPARKLWGRDWKLLPSIEK